MKTKKPVARKAKVPARKLPRATKHAARKVVRHSLPKHRLILAHPVTIFLLMCIGVLIVGLTYKSFAENINVTAKVAAPLLSEGAVITDPIEGQVFKADPITVTGTCPDNSYVNLYRNSAFSGSAWCVSNSFSIITSLSSGTNTLLTQDFNITDDPGPVTTAINVTYNAPPPIVPPAQVQQLETHSGKTTIIAQTQIGGVGLPLSLTADYHFKAFPSTSLFKWSLDLEGGTAPYVLNIDWGDNTTSRLLFKLDPVFLISHSYKKAGYYLIKIHVVDSKGNQTYLQIAALIKIPGTLGFTTTTSHNSGPPVPSPGIIQRVNSWLWLIWPTYGVVMLMALSFWLGERQEILQLARRRHRPKRRHA